MKCHNPFLFLAGALAAFCIAAETRAASPAETRAALALAFAANAKPPDPFANSNKASSDCDCGNDCTSGKKVNSLGERSPLCSCQECRCSDCRCGTVPELRKSYAKQWQADGWEWNQSAGYWSKSPQQNWAQLPASLNSFQIPQQVYQPQFMPMQQFGGFRSFGGGSCGAGG